MSSAKPEESPKSWADSTSDDEIPEADWVQQGIAAGKHKQETTPPSTSTSTSAAAAAVPTSSPPPQPTYAHVVIGGSNTPALRVIEPTGSQIFAALEGCGIIRTVSKPPDSFKAGSEVQRALYRAYYENPRGIRTDDTHPCWKTTTTCLYAKLVAIIYELTDHKPTRENIEQIQYRSFSVIYAALIALTGNHWFGVYPLFENAKLHLMEFNHMCATDCVILAQRATNASTIESKLCIEHKLSYRHGDHAGRARVGEYRYPGGGGRRQRGALVPVVVSVPKQSSPQQPPTLDIGSTTVFPTISISESLKSAAASEKPIGIVRKRRGVRRSRDAVEAVASAVVAETPKKDTPSDK